MTNKIILWIIKFVLIIFVMLAMTAAHKLMGVPILVKNMIGFAAIFAIWKYQPTATNNENDQNSTNS